MVKLDFMDAVRGTTTQLQADRDGKMETINVRIPPGVPLRARGCASGGQGGGGEADKQCYIVTHIRPHAYFTREGADIYITVPISIVEAALGAKIDVPTVDGISTVTVPATASRCGNCGFVARASQRSARKGSRGPVHHAPDRRAAKGPR